MRSALGADDVLLPPLEDAELYARICALSRLAAMEVERRRREAVLRQFGVAPAPEMPNVPATDRIGILLIGPAGGDQIQVMAALGGAATAAYAETADSALDRLRRGGLDVALITGSRDHNEVRRLCAEIRADLALFDLPVLLVGRPDAFPDRALPSNGASRTCCSSPSSRRCCACACRPGCASSGCGAGCAAASPAASRRPRSTA